MVGQYIQKKEKEKRIEEEQAAKARYWKIPVCYDDDDDGESSIPLKDIIISGLPPYVAITPDFFNRRAVDSIIWSESRGISPDIEMTNEYFTVGQFEEIYSNPLFDEEIISFKIDASIISKIDSLVEQFSDELAHIDLIPPGINEADFDLEEDILLSPSPIPGQGWTLIEEIDIFLDGDGSIPPGIESDDYDSEDDDNSTSRP
ncbi:hypothetical protein Tco_0019536 [Tanacetum coccineum]